MVAHSKLIHDQSCALCGLIRPLTFHHLIPRTCHRNKWFKKNFTTDDMKTRGINVCRGCHKLIHRTYNEKELGRRYNTLNKLLSSEPIAKYIEWAKKHSR